MCEKYTVIRFFVLIFFIAVLCNLERLATLVSLRDDTGRMSNPDSHIFSVEHVARMRPLAEAKAPSARPNEPVACESERVETGPVDPFQRE